MINISTSTNMSAVSNIDGKDIAYMSASWSEKSLTISKNINDMGAFLLHQEKVLDDFSEFESYVFENMKSSKKE